ncbi:MAG: hypothetical protein QM831_30145 [Kofleriaceae bacterium]
MKVCALVLLATGCTTWSTETVYGPKQEVERRLLGSPAIETSNSSDFGGGFSHESVGEHGGGRHHGWHDNLSFGSVGGSSSSSTITHCVQQAEIHYRQGYDEVPAIEHRAFDIAGAGLLFAVAGSIALMTVVSNHAEGFPGDPYYMPAGSTAPGLVTAGVFGAAGVGLLVWSFGVAPNRTKPQVEHGERDLVETEQVEASGCGLPGDPAAQR